MEHNESMDVVCECKGENTISLPVYICCDARKDICQHLKVVKDGDFLIELCLLKCKGSQRRGG